MGRGAPNKKGLDYFPKMVDFYEDDKIFELLDRYGPLGVTVYDCILCIVYKHGYYAEIPLDKLSKMIIKMIGNKWVKSQKAVVQVVHFCSEIGLIDDDLMTKNIITSVGIQRRYYEIAVKRMKRQLYTGQYWLLGKAEDGEPLLSVPLNRINSEENRINSEENRINSEESALKIKGNIKDIDIRAFPPELEAAFQMYLVVRRGSYGEISEEQIQALRDDLIALSEKENEQMAIVKKATASGWKSFYPLKKQANGNGGERKQVKPTKNRFNNFPQREYDFDTLEAQLLEAQRRKSNEPTAT